MRTIELINETISNGGNGVYASDLATQYRISKWTIFIFLKIRDITKEADVANGMTTVLWQAKATDNGYVVKLLVMCMKENELVGQKALMIY